MQGSGERSGEECANDQSMLQFILPGLQVDNDVSGEELKFASTAAAIPERSGKLSFSFSLTLLIHDRWPSICQFKV